MTAEKLTDSNGNIFYRAGNLCGGWEKKGKWFEIWKPADAMLEDGIVLMKFHQEEFDRVLLRLQAGDASNVTPEDVPAAIEIMQTAKEE